jgi:hypothetical protein
VAKVDLDAIRSEKRPPCGFFQVAAKELLP